MDFIGEKYVEIICIQCESEFKIKELHSDYNIHYCPYCGEELDIELEDE